MENRITAFLGNPNVARVRSLWTFRMVLRGICTFYYVCFYVIRGTSGAQNRLFFPNTLLSYSFARSYREYCTHIGPGRLQGKIAVQILCPTLLTKEQSIKTPSYESIETLNKEIWETYFIDLDEYCSNPDLIRRSLFLGYELSSHFYFWDKKELTERYNNEMAVYDIYREWAIHRLADLDNS